MYHSILLTAPMVDNHFVQQNITKEMKCVLDSTMKIDTTAKANKPYPVYNVRIYASNGSLIGHGVFDAVADKKNLKDERNDAVNDTKAGNPLNIMVLDPYLQNLPKDQWPKPGRRKT